MKPCDYEALDSGIRETVRLLRNEGFETTDSGDGVSKPQDERVYPMPHVAAVTSPDIMVLQAERMVRVLGANWWVEATYSTRDRRAILFAAREEVTTQEGQ